MSTALLRSPPEFRRGEKEREREEGEERSKEAASLPPSLPPHHPPRAPPSKAGGGGRCVLSLDDKKRKARSRTITPRGSDLGLHAADGEGGRTEEGKRHHIAIPSSVPSDQLRRETWVGPRRTDGRTEGRGPSFPFGLVWPFSSFLLFSLSSRNISPFPPLRSPLLRSVAVIYTRLIFCNFLPTSEVSETREHRVVWQIGRHISVEGVCDNMPKAYCK